MHIARGLITHSPGEPATRSKPRLTRASAPRVRTGCQTCKARRVKCDERKPTCDRCAKAHRKCEGYDEQALASASEVNSESAWITNVSKASQPSGSSMPIRARQYHKIAEQSILNNIKWDPSPLLVDASQSNLTYEERWFLNFFRHTTAQTNAIYFYKPFWGMLIYQASEVQPAARHAVIGIGSLHWGSMMDPDFAASGQMVSFSLRQCNKALNYMSGNMADGTSRRTRMETVLVSCAILVALAFGQGDASAGGRHIRAGFGLLHEWQKVKMDDSPIGSVLLGTFYQIFLDWPALIDVDDGSRSYSYPHQLVGGDQVGSLIETPEEACGVLLILGWLLLQIKPHSLTHTFYDSVPFAVLKRLRLWRYSILEQNNFQPLPFLSQEKRETIAILDIWRNVILIKGISDDRIAEGEMRYDDYLSYFQDTVRQAGELLAQGSLRSIWFKSGIVAPLFFCAFKCRDWDTRREALDLLTGWSSENGIWSISKTALVLDCLIRIESQCYKRGQIIPRNARIDSVRVEFQPSNTEVKFWYRRPVCLDGKNCQFDAWQWHGELIPY